ncbi:MAG TPA: hypothetical protein VFW03_21410 [Gemmatimonadaceae bacterium]|nr:hypothetical protein [Gemmatimonadaceae bacterium]
MRKAAMTVVAAALAAVSSSATAQATAQPAAASNAEKVAQYTTDQLKSELNLTADQIPKVQKINVATAKSLQQLVDKYDADTSAQAASALTKGLVAAVRTNQAELKKVLTPAQWTQHQGNKAQRLAMSQTEVMASKLDLSRQQILDVQRINMDGASKLVAALDKPMAGGKPTHTALLEAAKPVIDARDAELQKVLTVEQWKKMATTRNAFRSLLVDQASAPTPAAAAAAPKPKP